MTQTTNNTVENNSNKSKLVAKMRVAVRIRPPLPREINSNGKFLSCVGIGPTTDKGQTIFINSSDQPVIMSHSSNGGKISRYTFDKIFAPNTTQDHVYNYTMEPLVQAVLDGYNATILAYGQTGSGKTHTILGEKGDREGLTGRAIRRILQESSVSSASLSILQVYQDNVFDLLSSEKGDSLTVRQTYQGVKIDELTEIIVKDMEEVYGLLKQAQKNRAVGGTLLNEVSSRSHMIICITVRQSRVVNRLLMN